MPHESAPLLSVGLSWCQSGHRVAIATVVKTWGSSPRQAGSLLVICDSGDFVGSVSGGCIEGAVIAAAQKTMSDGVSQLLSFGVTQDMAWEVGLACGGRVEVWVERADPELLQRLVTALVQRQPLMVVTSLATGQQQVLEHPEQAASMASIPATLASACRDAFARDAASDVELSDGQRFFLWPFLPALRLLIVGAVHTAQPLSQMAMQCDLDVTIIDPRTAFATESRFPSVTLCKEWPEPALERLGLDRRTALVTLTHDPKLDEPPLAVALRSEAFYIGALGSGKTHATRLQRLREQGFSDDSLSRIQGPIGLRIGARSPAEIAVSILAQLIAVLRRERP